MFDTWENFMMQLTWEALKSAYRVYWVSSTTTSYIILNNKNASQNPNSYNY